jgi:hypothetical protein
MPEIINFNSLQKVQEQREEYSMKKSDYNVHVSGSSLHVTVLRFLCRCLCFGLLSTFLFLPVLDSFSSVDLSS